MSILFTPLIVINQINHHTGHAAFSAGNCIISQNSSKTALLLHVKYNTEMNTTSFILHLVLSAPLGSGKICTFQTLIYPSILAMLLHNTLSWRLLVCWMMQKQNNWDRTPFYYPRKASSSVLGVVLFLRLMSVACCLTRKRLSELHMTSISFSLSMVL